MATVNNLLVATPSVHNDQEVSEAKNTISKRRIISIVSLCLALFGISILVSTNGKVSDNFVKSTAANFDAVKSNLNRSLRQADAISEDVATKKSTSRSGSTPTMSPVVPAIGTNPTSFGKTFNPTSHEKTYNPTGTPNEETTRSPVTMHPTASPVEEAAHTMQSSSISGSSPSMSPVVPAIGTLSPVTANPTSFGKTFNPTSHQKTYNPTGTPNEETTRSPVTMHPTASPVEEAAHTMQSSSRSGSSPTMSPVVPAIGTLSPVTANPTSFGKTFNPTSHQKTYNPTGTPNEETTRSPVTMHPTASPVEEAADARMAQLKSPADVVTLSPVTLNPVEEKTLNPISLKTLNPVEEVTLHPTIKPTNYPSAVPTKTLNPTKEVTQHPTIPTTTLSPVTLNPVEEKTLNPVEEKTLGPVSSKTLNPIEEVTLHPTIQEEGFGLKSPVDSVTLSPVTLNPVEEKTLNPVEEVTLHPTYKPTKTLNPTKDLTMHPTLTPMQTLSPVTLHPVEEADNFITLK